ncbi:eukaryotic translation initiation factor 1A-like protein [Tanacetum coccineum]
MPKNKGRGKNRRRGTNDAEDEKRELEFKKEGQEYGQVLRMLGNGRCEDTKADIVHRYYHHEARSLKAYGELPECMTGTDSNQPDKLTMTWILKPGRGDGSYD